MSRRTVRSGILVTVGLAALVTAPFVSGLAVGGGAVADPAAAPATQAEVVATYDSLAEGILALKKSEENLVWSFLAAGRAHAQHELDVAQAAIKAGDSAKARASIENLAALIAQLGNEGDNSVARVRKRLLDGGQHHNAEGEAKGIYDEGFVIVTKAAKKTMLDASRSIAQLGNAPDAAALTRHWAAVTAAYDGLKKK
ncbi:MAG TPA: hypothetical protein VFD71_06140 [Planctomycetota bacterium]|jgi:hypothetical protein|nr:hypothetical protein [Planctomycetota bacterium]